MVAKVKVRPRSSAPAPARAWLSEFLLIRGIVPAPDGRYLYSYQVTQEEFNSLCSLLKKSRAEAFSPVQARHYAACFCLYVSESYRRSYDGASGWSWAVFEEPIACSFSPQQHAEMVKVGLAYWKRPVRRRENGHDWLGSLFLEGGLPWLLVQSESHGFGRAVRKGIKQYHRTEAGQRTMADLMADHEQYLPLTFRNLETRQLLAGIVEQLIYLVEQFPLREQEDPAAYLDAHYPAWRSAFPIPLGERNGRGLVNDWLKNAGQRRREDKEAAERTQAFICKHRLLGELPAWHICTELVLPKEETLKLDTCELSTTRLELGYYEGEQLLAKGGAVYAQIDEHGVKVRFPSRQVLLNRRETRNPVSLHLLENGRSIHIFHLKDSVLDYEDTPLIFEPHEEEWWFASSFSTSIAAEKVRLRLPEQYKVTKGTVQEILKEENGAEWLDSSDDIQLCDGQDLFSIRLRNTEGTCPKPYLSGVAAFFGSLPANTFLGWPQLKAPEEYWASYGELREYANGQPAATFQENTKAGVVRYSVKNAKGETILRRRFGFLPKKFQVYLYPALQNTPARIKILNGEGLTSRVVNENVITKTTESTQGNEIFLYPRGEIPPSSLKLEIVGQYGSEPVQLRLPYPDRGARLVDSDGELSPRRKLILDELLGMRIVLSASLPQEQKFYLSLELINRSGQLPKRQYMVRVGAVPVELSMFSYQNDMIQMLGAVDSQDAFIRMTVETEQRLMVLDIHRYNGSVHWEDTAEQSLFSIHSIGDRQKVLSDVGVAAMLLSDPKQAPLHISEQTSQDVGVGRYRIPTAMERKGPWLIYPENNSDIQFRPVLYVPSKLSTMGQVEAQSLHQATELYHPYHNPGVIDGQIAQMANDFDHSGWQYLADLKKGYSHLPLSSFESWLSLARHPQALAAAVFKMELDEAFCSRIKDELAVVWEWIPLPLWASTYVNFRNWLEDMALPAVLQQRILENRKIVMPAVVSGFEYVDIYLETADSGSLKSVGPEYVLPTWYQDLRRRHESNERWPTEMGELLASWVNQQDLPKKVKELSQIWFTDAVTYFPIFMAHVTAGKARLYDLPIDLTLLKFITKLISDFDRSGWYSPVHTLMVSYLLASSAKDEG